MKRLLPIILLLFSSVSYANQDSTDDERRNNAIDELLDEADSWHPDPIPELPPIYPGQTVFECDVKWMGELNSDGVFGESWRKIEKPNGKILFDTDTGVMFYKRKADGIFLSAEYEIKFKGDRRNSLHAIQFTDDPVLILSVFNISTIEETMPFYLILEFDELLTGNCTIH